MTALPDAWSQRRRLSAQELLGAAPTTTPLWPLVSLGLLPVLAAILAPGLLSALMAVLVLLALALWLGAGAPTDTALRRFAGVMWPLAALQVLGVGMGFQRLADGQVYDFLRDGWYFLAPMLVLAVGFIFGRAHGPAVGAASPRSRARRALVLGGAVLATLHLLWFVFNPQLLDWRATEIRSAIGGGWFAPALALLILVAWAGQWRSGTALAPWAAGALLLLCAAGVVLSFSRVLAVVGSVGILVVLGALARHAGRRIVVLLLLAALAIVALRVVIDPHSESARTSFLGKFARVPEELWPSDRLHGREVHDNWRGYETARALRHWAEGHPGQWILGDGFGALVDLGRFHQLSPNPRERSRFIPLLHNGYAQVLVKTGLLGLALYGLFLWRLFRLGSVDAASDDGERRRDGRLLQAVAVTLTLATGVWTGVFARFDLLPFVLAAGWLLARPGPGEETSEPPR